MQEDHSGSVVPLRFTVPDGLTELDLHGDPDERVQRTYEALRGASPAGEQEVVRMVVTQEAMLARLLQEGAVYAAMCLARSEVDPAQLVTAQFSVLVKAQELHGQYPLRDVSRGLRSPGEPREVVLNEFPAGEALVIGEEVRVGLGNESGDSTDGGARVVRQAQVVFAFPGNERIAILTLASEHLDDWPYFVAMLDSIAHSVSFSNGETSSIADRLSGAL